ncbi:MAG: 1-acyl-sn-glycerol-3-phosphate acyltransferase [Crocinitomicaceae bacterium]|jgi:1-acyl-sn-glycerol-3-phosphate acyltransferase
MRILYFLLKITLPYSLRIFYPRMKLNNSPKTFLGSTIYVSNHAASFMDPLAIASLRMPIVFFMTRSDVFTTISKPFLWACQMLPIYRQQDGDDTKGKNEAVFQTCKRVLKNGRNLLIFGEGFTDDTFIRRLKPVKKGGVRIGFLTLVDLKWKKKIYIAGVGCNYSDPNVMRSDLLISTSDRICLNDYREAYEANPNKVINELTKVVEKLMQEQITHVIKKEDAPLHENIMRLTRKGMNSHDFDRAIPLKKRWRYSQNLAHWLNKQEVEENESLSAVKSEAEGYFKLISRFKLEERLIFWKINNPKGGRMKEILMMVLLLPAAILGIIHCGIPYILISRFVKKSFRRKVFWGSVKLIFGMLAFGLLNIPFIFLFYHFGYPSWWLAFAYYASIGLLGLSAYMWVRNLKDFKKKGIVMKTDISKFISKREALIKNIQAVVPSEFH